MRLPHPFLALAIPACLALPAGAARGQRCPQAAPAVHVTSETSLAELAGRRILAVHVVTADPAPLPGPAALLNVLHVRTRESTVRRELLVAPGDTVDTLRVAESLRRLRRLRYLVDARVQGTACGDSVELTFITRDGWSTRPNVQVGSSTAAVELEERNLLGTGRRALVELRSDRGRVGVGVTLRDPAAFGGRAVLSVGGREYRDGNEFTATVARRERSVMDPWSYEAYVAQSSRAVLPGRPGERVMGADAPAAPVLPRGATVGDPVAPYLAGGVGDAFRRTRSGVLVARRVHASGGAVTLLQGGVEYEHAGLAAAAASPLVGSRLVRRELAALDVGLRRRSVAFDTLTWLLPGSAVVDVPLTLEYDALLGVGRETIHATPITHLDLWAGRMWRAGGRSLLSADLWASAYQTPGRLAAASLRGGVVYDRAARRGVWTARLGAEWLRNPDPDLRAMVTADVTTSALPDQARLAEGAVALSLERDVRVRKLSRSWGLDAAAFGALSAHWDPAAPAAGSDLALAGGWQALERLDVGMLGVGLRLTPMRAGRATTRLDLGYPLIHPAGVRPRPVLAISVTPWLDQGRHRDGRADP